MKNLYQFLIFITEKVINIFLYNSLGKVFIGFFLSIVVLEVFCVGYSLTLAELINNTVSGILGFFNFISHEIKLNVLKFSEVIIKSITNSIDFYSKKTFNIHYATGLNNNFVHLRQQDPNSEFWRLLTTGFLKQKISVAIITKYQLIRPQDFCLYCDYERYAIAQNMSYQEFSQTPLHFYKNLEILTKYQIVENYFNANFNFHPRGRMAFTYILHIKNIYVSNMKHLDVPVEWINGAEQYKTAVISDFNSWGPAYKEIYYRSVPGFKEANSLVKTSTVQKLILNSLNDYLHFTFNK